MKITYVVRRFGPVGGMERYVWETVLALSRQGHDLTVLCERCEQPTPAGLSIHQLGEAFPRPRWLALLRFGARVRRWLDDNPDPDRIVHSHERLACHHLTTYHGPPFATIFERPWWRWLSLRVAMQLYLERRELSVASPIVPVSYFIRDQIAHYYPQWAPKLSRPVLPGVLPGRPRENREIPAHGGIVGFVGKEWRRKGLDFAVQVMAQLRQRRPQLEFHVIGADPAEVQHLFKDWTSGYRLVPWSGDVPYASLDLLLHPARAEPFGMVITEAMSARLPVVVSDRCGAAQEVSQDAGSVLSLNLSVEQWAEAVERQLSRPDPVPLYERSWDQVAAEYVDLYQHMHRQTPGSGSDQAVSSTV